MKEATERSVIGMLLKMERLKQNKGQKEVCYGVCVTSYLSKIENGTVQADKEILLALFEKLGIVYEEEEEKLKEYDQLVDEYFYKLEYGLEPRKTYQQIKELCQGIEYSKYAVEWMIIRGYEGEDVISVLKKIESVMTPKQKAHFSLLLVDKCHQEMKQSIDNGLETKKMMLEESQKAYDILRNSYSFFEVLNSYFFLAEYSMIHKNESNFIAMAVQEGNTFRLAQYYFLSGSAYACLNREEMMIDCYERTSRILQNTSWNTPNNEMIDTMNYNLGATYISLKEYEKAQFYLEKISEETMELFEPLHKKAIVMIRLGKIEEGEKFLEKAKKALLRSNDTCESDWLKYEEAKWECKENFQEAIEYLELLEKLMRQLEKEQHFGHLYFYKDVMINSYIKHRKYKQALEFERKISSIVTKTAI